jgi:uncharacterized protein YbcV (DUF1398 family)
MALIINNPYQFEEEIANLFKKMGYEANVTAKSGDYGVDVIARKDKDVIAIQVKLFNYGNNVGNTYVQKLLGSMQLSTLRANKSILITSSDFTIQANEQAKAAPIELWNGDYVKSIFANYCNEELIFEFGDNLSLSGALLNQFSVFNQVDKKIIVESIDNLMYINAATYLAAKTDILIITSFRLVNDIAETSPKKKVRECSGFQKDFEQIYLKLNSFKELREVDKDAIIEELCKTKNLSASLMLMNTAKISIYEAFKTIKFISSNFPTVYSKYYNFLLEKKKRQLKPKGTCLFFLVFLIILVLQL